MLPKPFGITKTVLVFAEVKNNFGKLQLLHLL